MFIIAFIFWLLIICIAFSCFDRVLYLEYHFHRRNWENDGRPFGYFWIPPEARRSNFYSFLGSSTAHRRLTFNWLFVSPSWVRGDLEARVWLNVWRIFAVTAMGGVVPVLWVLTC